MGKLKALFKNKHVITTVSLAVVISVIWLLLYLMISYPIEFVAFCIALIAFCFIGYFAYITYMFILGFVEDYKRSSE